MNQRLVNIQRLVTAYSAGDFTRRVALSDNLDETDAVISVLHMLGEELAALTVSRDYFNNIFNTVSEMVLVLTARGVIEELNKAVCDRLGYLKAGLVGRSVEVLTGESVPLLFRQIRKDPGPDGLVRVWDRSFVTAAGDAFPVEIVARVLPGPGVRGRGPILLTAKDVGPQQAAERRLLRAVIDAQEQERQRLARDLHDGLGQQLSAVKFLVSTAARECVSPNLGDLLRAANESLVDVLALTRRVCRNLMPPSLEDFGLVETVRELGLQLEQSGIMRVSVEVGRGFPELPRPLQIDLYRVIQEFVGNSIRHGEATFLQVGFAAREREVEVRLRDNGKGFDPVQVQGTGMGLRNMHSRIRSHQGVFLLESWPGKGTRARVRINMLQSY